MKSFQRLGKEEVAVRTHQSTPLLPCEPLCLLFENLNASESIPPQAFHPSTSQEAAWYHDTHLSLNPTSLNFLQVLHALTSSTGFKKARTSI